MRKSCFVAIHGDLQVLEQERQISQTLFLSGKHGANGLSPVGIVVSNIVWNGALTFWAVTSPPLSPLYHGQHVVDVCSTTTCTHCLCLHLYVSRVYLTCVFCTA